MAASKKLKGWPDPWSPIDKATAGALIGVSRDTIERVANRVAAGKPLPKVRNPLAIPVGRIYGEEEPGSPVLAERIYKVLKVDPATLSGLIITPPAARAAPAAAAKPGAVPSAKSMQGMSDQTLVNDLSNAVARARSMSGGRVPWGQIKAIADELSKRNKPPGGMLHGQPIARIDLKKVETWGFMGVFMAQAGAGDLWPCVLPPNDGRPVDLLSASADEIRLGIIVALTFKEWLDLMMAALVAEALVIERKGERTRILKATPKGRVSGKSNGGSL